MPTVHKRTSPNGYETDYYIIKQMPNQTRRQFNAYQVSDAAEQRLLQAGLLYDGARISPNFFNTLLSFDNGVCNRSFLKVLE